jgi:hypothetical protein
MGTAPPVLPAAGWAPSAASRHIPRFTHGQGAARRSWHAFREKAEPILQPSQTPAPCKCRSPAKKSVAISGARRQARGAAHFCWPMDWGTERTPRSPPRTAVDTLYKHPDLSLTDMLAAVHDALRHTRGAAVAIAELDRERGTVALADSGISAAQYLPTALRRGAWSRPTARPAWRPGTFEQFTYPWTEGATLVLHSDGIATHWNLSDYPGLAAHDPAIVAGVVYRDFSRGNDDATIVVAR